MVGIFFILYMKEKNYSMVENINLNLMHELMESPEEDGLSELVFAARKIHYTLPYTVLSIIEKEGGRMGEASRNELKRARDRQLFFENFGYSMESKYGVRILKGVHLASLYPDKILRSQGDLDIVVDSEKKLWECAKEVSNTFPVERVDLSVIEGHGTLDWMISLVWPAEDPLNDPNLRVEISTVSLVGNLNTIHPKKVIHDNKYVAAAIALAEEGLQREPHPRDILDCLALAGISSIDVDTLETQIIDNNLSPEFSTLLEKSSEYGDLGYLGSLIKKLSDSKDKEIKRRVLEKDSWPFVRIRYGMPLDNKLSDLKVMNTDSASFSNTAAGDIVHTPLGNFLLTSKEEVSRHEYETAIKYLEEWHINS